MSEKKSVFGLSENLASVFSYLFVFISGFIVLILEKTNKKVRFHAMQSTVVFLLTTVLAFILGFVPFLGGMLVTIIDIVTIVLWVYLMYKSFKGIDVRVPIVGDIVYDKIYNS